MNITDEMALAVACAYEEITPAELSGYQSCVPDMIADGRRALEAVIGRIENAVLDDVARGLRDVSP